MICLHHNDLDGRAAAAIVYSVFPECRFIEMDYRSSLPIDQIGKDERVYIVDFSLQNPGDWEKLFARTGRVWWFDHHESAIKKAPQWVHEQNNGMTDTTKCGALITWTWFDSDADIPFALTLIDSWDRWTHKGADDVLNFVSGMKIESQNPESDCWKALFSDNADSLPDVIDIQRQGATIRAYEKLDNSENVAAFSHELNFDDHRCLALNSIRRSSLVFGDNISKYDICIAYVSDGKKWTVSLYSERVKVNDIATKYGGGGHPGAAGFICEQLPWLEQS